MDEKFLELQTQRLEQEANDTINSICNQVPTGPSTKTECDCGETIHPARVKIGYQTCIGCATAEYQRSQQYAAR